MYQLYGFMVMRIVSLAIMHIHHDNGGVSFLKGFILVHSTGIITTGFHCDSSPSYYQCFHCCYCYFASVIIVIITIIIIAIIIFIITIFSSSTFIIIIAILLLNVIFMITTVSIVIIIAVIFIIIIIIMIIAVVNHTMENSNAYLGILSSNHDHYFLSNQSVIYMYTHIKK